MRGSCLNPDPQRPWSPLPSSWKSTPYGQLTYLRVYQGSLSKGAELLNTRNRKRIKVGRLVMMHASEMEDAQQQRPGTSWLSSGSTAFSGDTFTDGTVNYAMTSMRVPEPVVSLAVTPKDNKSGTQMSKAIHRFVREDPTFRSHVDQESGETIISGMGELHLEIYVERMRREFGAEVETGMPQVAYREAISRRRISITPTRNRQEGPGSTAA